MKRFLLLSLLVGCTDHANIGTEPIKCKATASGAVNGTVENSLTGRSFSFGTPQASFMPVPGTTGSQNMVLLDDSNLGLDLVFQCPQSSIGLGTYDAAGGQQGCPFSVLGSVSQAQQQLYAVAVSGDVIVDQDTNCFAGRFDLTFGNRSPDQAPASGELSGWFSVPVQ